MTEKERVIQELSRGFHRGGGSWDVKNLSELEKLIHGMFPFGNIGCQDQSFRVMAYTGLSGESLSWEAEKALHDWFKDQGFLQSNGDTWIWYTPYFFQSKTWHQNPVDERLAKTPPCRNLPDYKSDYLETNNVMDCFDCQLAPGEACPSCPMEYPYPGEQTVEDKQGEEGEVCLPKPW